MTDLTTLKELLKDQVTVFGNGEIELTYHGLLKLIESSERRSREKDCEPKLAKKLFTKEDMAEFAAYCDTSWREIHEYKELLPKWENEYKVTYNKLKT